MEILIFRSDDGRMDAMPLCSGCGDLLDWTGQGEMYCPSCKHQLGTFDVTRDFIEGMAALLVVREHVKSVPALAKAA